MTISGLVTWAGLEAVRQGLPGLRWAAWMRAATFARMCRRCWWALVAFFGLATLASMRAIRQERMPLRGATLDRLGYAVVVLFHLILPVRPPPAVWIDSWPGPCAAACTRNPASGRRRRMLCGAPAHFLSLLTEWWL